MPPHQQSQRSQTLVLLLLLLLSGLPQPFPVQSSHHPNQACSQALLWAALLLCPLVRCRRTTAWSSGSCTLLQPIVLLCINHCQCAGGPGDSLLLSNALAFMDLDGLLHRLGSSSGGADRCRCAVWLLAYLIPVLISSYGSDPDWLEHGCDVQTGCQPLLSQQACLCRPATPAAADELFADLDAHRQAQRAELEARATLPADQPSQAGHAAGELPNFVRQHCAQVS